MRTLQRKHLGLVALVLATACSASVPGEIENETDAPADTRGATTSEAPAKDAPASPGATSPGGNAPSTGTTGGTSANPPPAPTAPGFFHAEGGKIVDAKNATVRLSGINWFGLETAQFAPFGLDQRGLGELLDAVKTMGFNMLRLPYSSQALDAGSTPQGIDFTKSPELKGKKPLEIIDAIVAGAKARGLRVILDRHRPDANAQSELWYTAAYSEERWISDWKMLAARYKNEPTVIGMDLHNEPHGAATWGSGDAKTDWRLAAERAGNAILAANPNVLIIVEGVEIYDGNYYWWGGNLRGVKKAPVRLNVAGRVVYSPHDYAPSIYAQPWFKDATFPNNLAAFWNESWGYIAKDGIAPVWVGEFGSKLEDPKDAPWMKALVSHLQSNGLSFAYWCLNPNSGDTGGMVQGDWKTVEQAKLDIVKPGLAPFLAP
jgi:endoglucanase